MIWFDAVNDFSELSSLVLDLLVTIPERYSRTVLQIRYNYLKIQ